jgi:D-alanyl-D-alanine carboxypeptidase
VQPDLIAPAAYIPEPRRRYRYRLRRLAPVGVAVVVAKVYINNNRLVGTYPGADGVKTGYTHKSGPCLVASATRGNVSLIAVVLDSPDMYGDAKRLLDFGFKSLSA